MTIWQQSQLAVWIVVIFQAILLISFSVNVKKKLYSNNGIPPGMNIPNISVSTASGEVKSLESLYVNDENTYFFIVKHGCKFCRELIPELDKINSKRECRIKLLIMDESQEAAKLIESTNTKLPYVIIPTDTIVNKFNVRVFPFGILVNKNGIVQKRSPLNKNKIYSFINNEGIKNAG